MFCNVCLESFQCFIFFNGPAKKSTSKLFEIEPYSHFFSEEQNKMYIVRSKIKMNSSINWPPN